MIPIRDTTPSKTIPIVNYSLIGLNVIVYLIQLAQGGDLPEFIYHYGLVPARYSTPLIARYFSFGEQLLSFLSFMFLHGGFWHLVGNIWFLYIFGDNVEDHLGPFRYVGFYIACGILSGASHLLLNLHSNVPVIGASGAIAGVMGAYFILYPRARILTLFPIVFIPFFFEIPAFFFLGLWFLLQFVNAAGSIRMATGIAWWAHVGGFVFGIVLLRLFGKVPATGITQVTRNLAERKTTHRLQIIRPGGPMDDPNLYGTLEISPVESIRGTRKLVNIPWGFHKQLFNVTVPPGTESGAILRLRGVGKQLADGSRGDILLKVLITDRA